MMRRGIGALTFATLVGLAVVGTRSSSNVDELLRGRMGFSVDDVRALRAGSAVIHSLDTPEREQIEHVSAVLLNVSADEFVDRFRDIERFERGPGTPQIGRFSGQPRYEDLASLTLPASDIEALRTCRPGNCAMKLSAEAMQRFRTEVDWESPRAPEQANRLARQMILELVLAYRASGNQALGSYDDGDDSMVVAEHLEALLAYPGPLPNPVPELLDYLHSYPSARPAGTEDFIYWTLVNFGLKDTVRVNHVTIYPVPERDADLAYVITTKQLYASHYFHTTLELRFLIDVPYRDTPSRTTLISITRSRNDGMTGFKGLFLRPVISRRSREGVLHYLTHVKEQVERPVVAW